MDTVCLVSADSRGFTAPHSAGLHSQWLFSESQDLDRVYKRPSLPDRVIETTCLRQEEPGNSGNQALPGRSCCRLI